MDSELFDDRPRLWRHVKAILLYPYRMWVWWRAARNFRKEAERMMELAFSPRIDISGINRAETMRVAEETGRFYEEPIIDPKVN